MAYQFKKSAFSNADVLAAMAKKKSELKQWAEKKSASTVILTDSKGVPIPKPSREEFESSKDFLDAMNAYKNLIAEMSSTTFQRAFAEAMKKKK